MTRLATMLLAAVASAQNKPEEKKEEAVPGERAITGSMELGYRSILHDSGNFDAYRSVVNLGEGPKLFNGDLQFRDRSGKIFDEGSMLMSSWGGDPYNSLRLDVRKTNLYNFLLDYRSIDYFNFLPSFANPRLENGDLRNQSSFDTRFRTTEVRLEIIPSRRVTPYLAYSRSSENGTSVLDFTRTGNEYPVPTRVTNRQDNYRGGVQFNYRRFHLAVEQGSTYFKDDQGAGEANPNPGNRRTPYLGQRLSLTTLAENYRVRSESYYSRGSVAVNPVSWASISGEFIYSNPRIETAYLQNSSGNFAIPQTLLFSSRSFSSSTGSVKMPRPSGSVRGELRPMKRFRVMDSWSTDRLHNSSAVTLAEQYLAPGSSVTSEALFSDRLTWNLNQNELLAFLDVTGYLTVRGGHRYTWGDSTATSGSFLGPVLVRTDLRRNTGLAGLSFRTTNTFRFNADFEAGGTGTAYYRTSLRDYRKFRARGSYAPWPAGSWRFSSDYFRLTNENPDPAVRWDFATQAGTAVLEWFPKEGKRYNVLAEYSRSTARSRIDVRVPQTLARTRSDFVENANTGTFLFSLKPGASHKRQPALSVGGSLYASTGSRPTRYYQPRARVSVPMHTRVHWNVEWRCYSMTGSAYPVENFASHQLVMSVLLLR
jgi:hypothetical protein